MTDKGPIWSFGGRSLAMGSRTWIMGVVNVTPDSFSDGGKFLAERAAVEQGLRLAGEGADILDVGGESTRPGSDPTPLDQELERVIPVVEALAQNCDALISVDTYKAAVAREAMAAGAHIINDITALDGDPEMAATAAQCQAGLVLMHMLGTPRTMQRDPHYQDVAREVADFLDARMEKAVAAGLPREAIALDPGIGFGKTVAHNLTLVRRLDVLAKSGRPVLLGASRKTFIGKITGREKPADRLWGTVGVHVAGALFGAHLVRVHDVAPVKEALAMADAVRNAGPED